MAVDVFANAANTTLTAALTAGATSLTVTSSTPFPAVTTAAATQFRVIIDSELFIVTDSTSTTWTVTPAAEGSTAATHLVSAPVTAILTAGAVRGFALVADIVTVVAAAGATQTLDAVGGTRTYDVTLSAASCAFTLAGAVAGRANVLTALLRQDATGRRVATWPGTALWATGAAPVLSTAASRTDVVQFLSVDNGASWLGSLLGTGYALPSIPSAPTSLAAASSSNSAVLTWIAVTGATPAVSTYNVYRGLATNPTTLLAGAVGNVTTYTDATAVNGTTYFYRVTAVNTTGESAFSNNASASPVAATGLPALSRTVTDGVLNSTTTITSATANFTSADVGRPVGNASIPGYAYIASVTNSTTAVLSAAASATASAQTFNIGYIPVQWFKADALGLANGASVSSFTDSSTNAKPATQATAGLQPTFVTAQVNSLPVVRFVKASSQVLTSTYLWAPAYSQSMFVVVKETASGSINAIFGAAASFSLEIRYSADNTIAVLKGGATTYVASSSAVPNPTTAFSIVGATLFDNGTNVAGEVTVNGTLTSGATAPTGASGQFVANALTIGQGAPDGYFGGDIAEIIVYPFKLNTADRRSVEAYLSSKYAITVV